MDRIRNLNTARLQLGGIGTQGEALAFGGDTPPHTVNTEDWDGVTWTEVANLATSRQQMASAGTNELGLAAGGFVSAVSNATEEWTKAQNVKVITD